jgi:hypothetical protein
MSRQLIDVEDLRRRYIELYVQVRKYIWPFDTVANLVDVEMECYSAFPDMLALRTAFSKLKSDIEAAVDLSDDKDLKDAIEEFQKLIDRDEDFFNLLEAVKEVMSYEDIQEQQADLEETV